MTVLLDFHHSPSVETDASLNVDDGVDQDGCYWSCLNPHPHLTLATVVSRRLSAFAVKDDA